MPAKPVKEERQPVGVLPYRLPPLSGLYRLRYRPPSATDKTDANVNDTIGESATSSIALANEERHRNVHSQLLRSASLDDGDVDLFALYSVCAAEPVACTNCTLHMDTTTQTCSYRLRETFSVPEEEEEAAGENDESLLAQVQRGWYAFFFPMSECGRLKDNVLVCVNDALIAGDVAACDFAAGGVLRALPKTKPAAFAGSPQPFGLSPFTAAGGGGQREGEASPLLAASHNTKETDAASSELHVKPLFYYVVSPITLRKASRTGPTEVTLAVSWRSFPAAQPRSKKSSSFTLLYSYLCAPRAPDTLTCRAQFATDARLRLVRSPNCDGAVQLQSEVTPQSARLRVVTVDGAPLQTHRHLKDYTFQVCFYFGDYTGLMEETSFVAAALVGAVALVLLWFFLTKDLVV